MEGIIVVIYGAKLLPLISGEYITPSLFGYAYIQVPTLGHATCRVFSLTAPRESAFMLLIGPDYGQFQPVCHETYVISGPIDRNQRCYSFVFLQNATRCIARVVGNRNTPKPPFMIQAIY